MADQTMTQTQAMKNATWAHNKWAAAADKAEGLRATRNLAIVEAAEAGATHTEIATQLGLTKQAVSSIIARQPTQGAR